MLPPPCPRAKPSSSSASSPFGSSPFGSRFVRPPPLVGRRECKEGKEEAAEVRKRLKERREESRKEEEDETKKPKCYFANSCPSVSPLFPGLPPPKGTAETTSSSSPSSSSSSSCSLSSPSSSPTSVPPSSPTPPPPPPHPSKVTLSTRYGDIVIRLFTSLTPRTCYNFTKLCSMSYYNNTVFHRVVKGFMIQGGDPTGTGRGGRSVYGEDVLCGQIKKDIHNLEAGLGQGESTTGGNTHRLFEDEFVPELSHDAAGVVSMANCGTPNTNGSQFFITLDACRHLDRRNTVFGKVQDDHSFRTIRKIGGGETIGPADDKPTDPIAIISTKVEQEECNRRKQR
eukprot:GHVS01023608.1.p1 GENE.GHVS01023608.1~~GHVS01023608.1.p1  ORF type:complete len:377 (+),score=137.91 GHVS01023608.1:110-1132(+)